VRENRTLRSTWRGLETWHGRDGVTLADERARQQGTQTSTYTGAPVLDPTWEGLGVKFPGPLDIYSHRPVAPAIGWRREYSESGRKSALPLEGEYVPQGSNVMTGEGKRV
jgi:hypothetical protein